MRKLIDLVLGLFNTPSDFANDPEQWVNNQSAHALFVGGGFMLIITAISFSGLYGTLSVGSLLFVMACYALWEGFQLLKGSGVLDGIADWAFVSSGAVLVWAGMLGDREVFSTCLIGVVIALLLGVLKRL